MHATGTVFEIIDCIKRLLLKEDEGDEETKIPKKVKDNQSEVREGHQGESLCDDTEGADCHIDKGNEEKQSGEVGVVFLDEVASNTHDSQTNKGLENVEEEEELAQKL